MPHEQIFLQAWNLTLLSLVKMEIIGGIASISQIACFALNISRKIHAIRSELRDAPKRIKRQEAHLISLLHIVQSIKKSYVCYPTTIGSHLNRIQEIIGALQRILVEDLKYLKKEPLKRMWRAILIIRSEGRILAIFDSLEAEKSSLLLVLAGNQGEILQEIRHWTETMSAPGAKVPYKESEQSPHELDATSQDMQSESQFGEQPENHQRIVKLAGQEARKDTPRASTGSSESTSNAQCKYNSFKDTGIDGNDNNQDQGNDYNTANRIHRNQWNNYEITGISGNGNTQVQGNNYNTGGQISGNEFHGCGIKGDKNRQTQGNTGLSRR